MPQPTRTAAAAARRRPRLVALLALAAALWASDAAAQNRWEDMDYGPFLSSSVTMPGAHPENPSGITLKGVTVRLDGGKAAMCFDTDLLRYSAGWTGGWLKLMGTPFDGTHRPPEGSRPAVQGLHVFTTGASPGWAEPGTDSFDDPRPRPYGPLPKGWAKYKGLYVNGDAVTFSYTVGDCPVLETPSLEAVGGHEFLARTFRVGPSDGPLTLLVAEEAIPADRQGVFRRESMNPGSPAISGHACVVSPGREGRAVFATARFPEGGALETAVSADGLRGRIVLRLPGLKGPADVKVMLARRAVAEGDQLLPPEYMTAGGKLVVETAAAPDWAVLTGGGKARYPRIVETVGKLGDADAAYAVDTLALPDENPWKSWMRVGGFDFFPDGTRAALCTWSGDVWVVSGIDEGLGKLAWKRYATGLFQPLGLKIVDGKVYVLGRDQITRFHDLNEDGEADYHENFNNDVEVTPNFHEFAFDLHTDPQGNFYFTKGAPLLGTHEFDPIGIHNGCVLKVSKDGGKLDVFATGLRAPNGAGVGPDGRVTCSDNQGIWTPVCRINLVKQGGFYGCMGTHHRDPPPTDYDPPLCWLPFAVDNSSGGQVWVASDNWGLPRGEMLHLSYGKCKLFHVLHEEVGGVAQGGVVRLPLNFASGVMRGRFNPVDGQLYVAGLKGWQTDGTADGCLQRVRYTGKPLRMPLAMKVTKSGVDLTFTDPLDRESAEDSENYAVERWNYQWTKEYGSPEFKVSNPNQQGRDEVRVTSAKLSADEKTVSLGLADIRPVMQMMIRATIDAADGGEVAFEVYNTVNRVP